MYSDSAKGQIFIVGEMSCCICGEAMTQEHVDKGEAIFSGIASRLPVVNIIAHVNHFYLKDKNVRKTKDYKLNMMKFALAVGRDNGSLSREQEAGALAQIKQLEGL
ncbi:MAG: hypothetical protein M3Q99_16850 [Acidobacteriota bacterium]|nr:hypothetical protein [Acidobacteriota bacterium]